MNIGIHHRTQNKEYKSVVGAGRGFEGSTPPPHHRLEMNG